MGGTIISYQRPGDLPVFCGPLSPDHSGSVSDPGLWNIGFLDDYLKVVLKRSDGLLPKQKLFCQLAVTTVFVVYLIFKDESGLTMVLPFTDYVLDIKWITVPLAYFAILGTDNGVNLPTVWTAWLPA